VGDAAPEAFAFVAENLPSKIVNVGSFAVEKIAEEAGLDHVEDEEFVETVTAIFHDHAVAASFF